LESWRNPVVERMSWYNFKHSFVISFVSFKLLTWTPFLWDSLAWILVLVFSYWFGFVVYRYLKRYSLAYQVASYKKSVLITGCDSGFGNTLARKLATERGFHVFAGCLNPEWEGGRKLAEINNVDVLKLDVTNNEDLEESYKQVTKKLNENGHDLWAVMCNAGIAEVGEFEWTSLENIKKHFDVNTFGAAATVKTFLPLLRASKGRVVINSSTLAHTCMPGLIGYSMSKAAVSSMADGLRRELAVWDVDVCTVEPTLYSTALIDLQAQRNRFLNGEINQIADTVRTEYGEEYFKCFYTSAANALKKYARSDLDEAVSMMSHAITTVWPESHYRAAPWKQHLFYTALDYLPSEFVDAICNGIAKRVAEPNAVAKS